MTGFFHIALFPGGDPVHFEIFNVIKQSGLLDQLDKIYLGIVGEGELNLPYQSHKIEIGYQSNNIKEGEIPTTSLLQEYCRNNPNEIVFKIHNSGLKQVITGNTDPKYPWWRYWMEYWTLVKWRECLELLECNDAVGPELMNDPIKHFSGTWYWAKAIYMNSLPSVYDAAKMSFGGIPGSGPDNWHCCEFLPGLNPNGKLKSIIDTGYHWIARHESVEKFVKPYLQSLPKEERFWE